MVTKTTSINKGAGIFSVLALARLTLISLMAVFFTGFHGFYSPPMNVTDLEKRKLKGKVRSVMVIDHFIKKNDQTGETDTIVTQELTLFDQHGNIYEVVKYKNGIASTISKYLFDSVGRQLLLREYERDGTLKMTVTYKFNNKGHRISAEYSWPDYDPDDDDFGFEVDDKHPYTTIIYNNDYRGYCVEEKRLEEDGSLYCRFVYDYDFKGNRSEMNYYNSDNDHTWRKVYKYNFNNLLKQSRTYKDNRIVLRADYTYDFDEQGNWIKRTERRHLYHNIYSSFFEKGDVVTNRRIEYYPQI